MQNLKSDNLSVSSDAWKREFLELLDAVESFDTLAAISRENEQDEIMNIAAQIAPAAGNVVANYEKYELRKARTYYNNSHLLAFWKWFLNFQKNQILDGSLNEEFPISDIVTKWKSENILLVPVSVEFFEQFFYWKTSGDPSYYCNCHIASKYSNYHKWTGSQYDSLEQLLGRLRMLQQKWVTYGTYLYNKFLAEQRLAASPRWDDYRIHYFLDLFLYSASGIQRYSSTFDNIFFSSNLSELEIYLRYCRNARIEWNLSDITAFLSRQRKYYMKLALVLSVEENAYLNSYRRLKYYDIGQKVVVMPEISPELRRELYEELIENAAFAKGAGCPFVKSKGVADSAAFEVFCWFDNMMLKIVERWLESLK